MDAQEIKTAVAHQDAARAAAEAPFVNLADPAQVLGPDGQPAVSRRAPMWADIPDEQWNDWRWQLSHRVNDLEEIEQVLELTDEEREGLSAPDKFRVDITPYFISLIDPKDPNDPIRRQVIPSADEHQAFTAMMEDSLAEDRHSPVPGLVHRYPDRVLMLVTTQCASYCRYCTRSRIVGDPTQNFNRRDHEAQLEYLRRTPQVRDVLISGGDGLTLAPKLFEKILRGLREIPHIEIIRIGSRVPVFLPQRIDDELCEMLAKYHPLWINLHFNHPNEITPEVSRAVDKLTRAGLPVGNQSVLLAGVNDCVHIQRAPRPQARREPDPPVLPVPVRPGRGVRPLPDAGRQGARDHRGPARTHVRLRRADLRHRCARRRRQDPGDAELPDQLLGPQGGAAQLRGLHHHVRGARDVQAARLGARARTASTSAPSPASRASWGCSRASGCGSSRRASRRSTRAATPRRTGSRTRRSGSRSASARSRARPARRCGPRGGGDDGEAGAGEAGSRRRGHAGEAAGTTGPARSHGRARANPPHRRTGSCSSHGLCSALETPTDTSVPRHLLLR